MSSLFSLKTLKIWSGTIIIENQICKTFELSILTFNLVQSFHDLSNILIVLLRSACWLPRNRSRLEAISIMGRGRCLQEMLLILEELFLRILIQLLLHSLFVYLLLNYDFFLTGLIQDVICCCRWSSFEVLHLFICLPFVVATILVISHLLL